LEHLPAHQWKRSRALKGMKSLRPGKYFEVKTIFSFDVKSLHSENHNVIDNNEALYQYSYLYFIHIYTKQTSLLIPNHLPYLNHGTYPALSELNDRLKGGKIYSCGYTIIEYILSAYGKDQFISLLKNYGNLQKVLGVSDDQFCKDWYAFIKAKYLS